MTSYLAKKKFVKKHNIVFAISLIIASNVSIGAEEFSKALPSSLSSSPKTTTTELNAQVPEYVLIRPSEQVTFSSETTASIAKINVKEGSTFILGEELLSMDCRVQEAELKKAKAQHDAAKSAFDSARRLQTYGSISKFELKQAEAQEAISNSDVSKLTAIVDKCKIIAPFNGAVADLMVHEHETVKPGDPLMKIVSTDKLDFELQVPSQWLEWIQTGSIFYVTVNETNKKVAVKVSKINPEIDSISQTVRIVGHLVEPDPSLSPGMSGQAFFPGNPSNALPQLQKGT